MIKLVAFDVAGTTVEEHAAVYTALEDAVVAAGGSPGTSDIQTWMGAGKREAITGLFRASEGFEPDTAVVDATFDDFRARLDASYRAVPPTPMPGVVETFEALHAAGIKVALTTGFDRDVVDRLLAVLGWGNPLLDAVVCIDDVAAGRPAPYMIFRAMEATGVHSVGDVLVVGDTVRDLEAGMNAGAGQVVGALTGDVPVDVLSASPHTHIVDSVADIPALLGLPARM